MHIRKGFELAKKYYPLVLLAALLDLTYLRDIASRYSGGIPLKFTIPVAVPSILQVLPEQAQDIGSGLSINTPFGYAGEIAIVLFALFMVLKAYLKGGFLGCVLEGVKDNPVDKDTFFIYASKFWGRFLVQSIIMFAGLLFLAFLMMGLGPLAILFILALLAAFFLLVLWDYSLVADDMGVVDAAERSWRLVVANFGKVLIFLLPILLITAIFSVFAFMTVQTPIVILSIFAYTFLGTTMIFAVMSFYLELTSEGTDGDQAPLV